MDSKFKGLSEYLEEAYKSKYASYLDDDEDDEDEDEEDNKKDDKEKVPTSPSYLSTSEIMKIRNIAIITLSKFTKLKKCCDYIDLKDKDQINDDGERESELDKYYHSGNPKAFIKLMDGDVFSGYPNFRNGGSDAYEEDCKEFTKAMNDALDSRGIKAKWCTGPDKEDEAISFGVRSTKTKPQKQ